MDYKIGDYIYATDEDAVLKIDRIQSEHWYAKYVGQSASRGFAFDATHYRLATEEEIKKAQGEAVGIYPFWVANNKDEIISNGHIRAYSIERAKEIYETMLERMKDEGRKIGDHFLSESNEAVM